MLREDALLQGVRGHIRRKRSSLQCSQRTSTSFPEDICVELMMSLFGRSVMCLRVCLRVCQQNTNRTGARFTQRAADEGRE